MKSLDTNSAGCDQRENITVIVLIHSPYFIQSRKHAIVYLTVDALKTAWSVAGHEKFKFEAGCEQSYEWTAESFACTNHILL